MKYTCTVLTLHFASYIHYISTSIHSTYRATKRNTRTRQLPGCHVDYHHLSFLLPIKVSVVGDGCKHTHARTQSAAWVTVQRRWNQSNSGPLMAHVSPPHPALNTRKSLR